VINTELAKRRSAIDPERLDNRLDLLLSERMPFGKARVALIGLKALRGMTRPSRGGEGPLSAIVNAATSRPPLNEFVTGAPDHVGYPIYATRGRAAVTLAQGAEALLQTLVDVNSSSVGESASALVWLSRLGSPDEKVGVHWGASLVGWLGPDDGSCFERPFAAAAERAELPWTYAQVVRRASAPAYAMYLELPGRNPVND
jgi:hypothetical protein